MLYACEKNVHMYDGIINLLKGLFQLDFSKSPALCVLSLLADSINLSGRQKLWVRLAAITGCRIILRHSKSSNSCCIKGNGLNQNEQVTYRVKGREDIFNQVWGPFLHYIEDTSV